MAMPYEKQTVENTKLTTELLTKILAELRTLNEKLGQLVVSDRLQS